MRRLRLLASVFLVLSATLLQAQRAGGGSRGVPTQMPIGSNIRTSPSSPSNGRFPLHSGFHRRGNGAVWLPWYLPYWDYWDVPLTWDLPFWDYANFPPSDKASQEASYGQLANTLSPVVVVESKESRPPVPPPEPPKLIEVPPSKDAPVIQQQSPALFVLTSGEQLESRHYLLTADSLQIEVGRRQRTIPVSKLDLDATITVNHQRGIEVTIPTDRTSVFLSF